MTTREALEKSRIQSQGLSDTPVMDEKKVQRLLSQATATFIRYKKPDIENKKEPKEKI